MRNGTTLAGPDLRRTVREYVPAYVSLHGRRKAAEHLGVYRHTLWRFLERGHMWHAVPTAVLNSVGESARAIGEATFELMIDLEGLRPDPALRSLRQGLRPSCYCAPHLWPPWRTCPASGASQPQLSETG